jgi:5-dehydro-2-deoxygluconokinase
VNSQLDLITIGRVSVDLYGQQIGSRLEDVSTFIKAVGGCPANVAIGAARLGLRSALISRVGNEPMGRFVIEQLARETVETRGVRTDPQRLTSVVLLSVRDPDSFPLIFYRDNCADSALCEDDIDESFVAGARAILVTGTHFSMADAAKAQRKAMTIARAHGSKVILDIDYRPNLWGIGGHDSGESRYARSENVTNVLQSVLPDCDLIVGTEEELHIAGGAEETLAAIRKVRALSNGVIVCKRGARGCIVFPGSIPDRLEDGRVASGMQVAVYNVLGAGDAFLAGFLRGYLHGEPHETSARLGNACGAIAVSRLLCSSEFATLTELNHYLEAGSAHQALREDDDLNHLHWATTRRRGPERLFALAVDHQMPFEETGKRGAAALDRVSRLQVLAVEAVDRVAAGREDFGVLLDGGYGVAALQRATQRNLWLARRTARPGSRPLEFDAAPSLATHLNEWPMNVAVECRCFYHPDDPLASRLAQERELVRLAAACRAQRRELVLEIVAGKAAKLGEDTVARALSRLYALGVRPDWWQLEPQASADAWQACADVIATQDSFCRGILVDGQDASLDDLSRALELAAVHALVRGFVVGRTIFATATEEWLSGRLSDEAAIAEMAGRFKALVDLWNAARQAPSDGPGRSRA